ncbi:rhomboid family intramembrane serine protease [Sorangium sp. So ce1036]|uniref:rhomboid family intramembrane serine protease n=1 Tax=Sorangium sp. So ce1036 TaxID=3133328 RepID=UPI003F120751
MDTFAAYLAKRYVAERGFTFEVPLAAAALVEACDLALTYEDGLTLCILCIVDAERDPSRRWAIEKEELLRIGKACLPLTGRMSGAKMPVNLLIIEVRPSLEPDDQARLKRLQRLPGLAKVGVTAMIAAPPTGEAWASAPLAFLQVRWLRKLLRAPRRADEPLSEPPSEIGAGVERPVATYALLGVMGAAFAGEHLLAVSSAQGSGPLGVSVSTLTALGGLQRQLVLEHGEWHRLLTATLLHGDVLHLGLNGFALYMAGAMLEHLLGRAYLVALFLVGAVGGSLLSLALGSDATVSVGASGAVMGLLAAAIAASFRLPVRDRTQVMLPMAQILVPSLIPLATHRSGGEIDYAAHLGGAVAGVLAGAALLRLWPKGARAPAHARAALAASALAVGLYAVGVATAASSYPGYAAAAAAEVIPDEALPTLDAADADALLARYPRDPRARWLAADKAAREGDLALAEEHLRKGLAEEALFRIHFPDRRMEAHMRASLAGLLSLQGRRPEAEAVARPACRVGAPELAGYCR